MDDGVRDTGLRMFVLAGGFGTRLRPAVADVPKALAPVGDIPFLQLQLGHWIAQGIRSFVFLLHHQADLIVRFLQSHASGMLRTCEVAWVIEPQPLGTGGAVARAVQDLKASGSILIANADTWLGGGIEELISIKAPAIAVVRLNDSSRYGRVHFDSGGRVIAFHEKARDAGASWVYAGLCHLDTRALVNWNQMPFSLEQGCFPALVSDRTLRAVALQTDFIDIGIPEDYFRFLRTFAPAHRGDSCS